MLRLLVATLFLSACDQAPTLSSTQSVDEIKSIVRNEDGTFTVICTDEHIESKVTSESIRSDQVCKLPSFIETLTASNGLFYRGSYKGSADGVSYRLEVNFVNFLKPRAVAVVCTADTPLQRADFDLSGEVLAERKISFESIHPAGDMLNLTYDQDFQNMWGSFNEGSIIELVRVKGAAGQSHPFCEPAN